MNNNTNAALPAIVLVHGGFVDGSGWEDVFQILKKDGYPVSIVQNPTTSLADDVAVTKRVIADQKGPVILVGRRRAHRCHQRARLEGQAQLVPGGHGRSDDTALRSAHDGEARQCYDRRGQGSHAIYVSQPKAVAELIEKAAMSLKQ